MRLPENKESRQKVLALIALGVVGVAYGIWVGVYDPLRRGRDEAKVKIVQMEEDLQAARVQIQRTGETRKELQGVVRDLLMHSEKEMLQPRLGNYLLQAREILTEAGKAAGVQYFSVTEVGLVDLPLQPKKTNTVSALAVRAYTARVTAECGTDALVQWLALLEKGNPLISVSHTLFFCSLYFSTLYFQTKQNRRENHEIRIKKRDTKRLPRSRRTIA